MKIEGIVRSLLDTKIGDFSFLVSVRVYFPKLPPLFNTKSLEMRELDTFVFWVTDNIKLSPNRSHK